MQKSSFLISKVYSEYGSTNNGLQSPPLFPVRQSGVRTRFGPPFSYFLNQGGWSSDSKRQNAHSSHGGAGVLFISSSLPIGAYLGRAFSIGRKS